MRKAFVVRKMKGLVVVILCLLLECLAAEKLGTCPDVGIVKGDNCDIDYECPGVEKCCDNTCVFPGDVTEVVDNDALSLVSSDLETLEDDTLVALYAYDRSRPKRQTHANAWKSLKTLRKASKALLKKQRQAAKAIRLEKKAARAAAKADKKKNRKNKKMNKNNATAEDDDDVTGMNVTTPAPDQNNNTMKNVGDDDDDAQVTDMDVTNQASGQSKMTKAEKEEKKKLKQMKRAEKLKKKQARAEKKKQKIMKNEARLKKQQERRLKKLEKIKRKREKAGMSTAN